jgi:putative ABC transport system permease protein
MLSTYLRFGIRNLLRKKVYSFINIFGLTIGLACFLFIALYIFDELTYDRFHRDAHQIYRIVEHKTSQAGKESKVISIAYNISRKAEKEFPEVEGSTRFSILGRSNVINPANNQTFYELYAIGDSSFFNVFDFAFVEGDKNNALTNPYSIVLTDETAKKYFGSANAVGKSLRTDRDSIPYKVTAVVKVPNNSHLQFNMLFSESTLYSNSGFMDFLSSDWSSNTFVSYLKIKEDTRIEQTEAKLDQLAVANRRSEEKVKSNFLLQPLKNIHFHSAGVDGEMGRQGNLMHMYVFGIVALFVLLIACINYINLTTARFASRSKEIAVRKVAGAAQKNLVYQFLSESFLVTFIALVLSLAVVKLLLPSFNAFTDKQLALGLHTDYRIWIGIVVITIFAGFVSGIYPAFFQARLKPYLLLKSNLLPSKSNFSIRRVLVVFQFSLSIIMIVATMVVYQQLRYVDSKDMGFNKEQLLVVDINSGRVRRAAETIKAEFSKLSGVKSVSVTSRVPGEWKVIPKVKISKEKNSSTAGEDAYYIAVDDRFLQTFEVTLKAGRNFTGNQSTDSGSVLLNETAARMLGIAAPENQLIEIPSVEFSGNASPLNTPFQARVIGIVKDFNFQSLRETIAPLVISYQRNPVHNIDYFTARINTGSSAQLLKQMESVLRNIDADHLFEYNFLDKQWDVFYREDQKREIIFLGVALMTILIACLGLFGLATFAAQQRIKEIGVRKVLGASVSGIVSMLSKDFLKLVVISAVFAFPVAGWAMNNWLQDFAYRISIPWWVFAGAGLLAILIAWVTVSFQAFRAAIINPVKALRTE